MKKQKGIDPIKHEEEYIQFLEKKLAWMKREGIIEDRPMVQMKLSKARLKLRLVLQK